MSLMRHCRRGVPRSRGDLPQDLRQARAYGNEGTANVTMVPSSRGSGGVRHSSGGIALKGRPKPPPFEEDPLQVARSLKFLLSKGANRFYLGYGGPLDAGVIERYAGKLAQAA